MFNRRIPRFMSAPATLITAFLTVAITYPGGLSAAYHDLSSYQDNLVELDQALAADAHLDGVNQRIANRIAVKDQIILDLVANRVCFHDAVRQFLHMNNSDPRLMAVLREAYSGRDDEECIARNVIDYLRQRTSKNVNSQYAIIGFEQEFERLYGCTASLP